MNYENDLISMTNERTATTNYYHYDGLGSVRQLTDDTEAVVAEYTYDAFGNLIASTGTTDNTYGFTGEQQFGETDGLVYLRARHYSPAIGRFISRDPIGIKGLYIYCKNNPLNWIDPLGWQRSPWQDWWEGQQEAWPPWRNPMEEAFEIEEEEYGGGGDPFSGAYRHCVTACLSVRRYGLAGLAMVAYWNTFLEDECASDYDSDVAAGWEGARKALQPGSCRNNCKEGRGEP